MAATAERRPKPQAGHGLSFWRLAAFASPATATSAVGLPIALYLPAYYATDVGLGLGLVGSLFMFAKVWDLITDPIVGIMTDRYPSRWGYRRHWIAMGAPLMLIGAILVYFPLRIMGEGVGSIYFLSAFILLYTGFTLVNIAHTSWGAELTDDYHERSNLQGWIQIFGLAGSFTVMAIPAIIEQFGDTTTYQFRVESMGWYMACMLPVTVVLALGFVPERKLPPRPKIALKRAIQTVAQNKHMLRLVVADFLLSLPAAARASLYVFFVGTVIGRPDWVSTILLLYFATGPIAIPIWMRVSRIVGKHNAVAYGLIAHGIFALAYLIPGEGDIFLFTCIHLTSAFVYGGHNFLVRAMVADVTDADNVVSGQQRTGLFYSLVNMTNKVGNAIGIGITFWVLAWIGYDATGNNDQETLNGVRYLFVFVPLVAEVAVAWVLFNYKLDETAQRELKAELEARATEK